MKKITALFLTLILFAVNVFAADVSETKTSAYWLEKIKVEASKNMDSQIKYMDVYSGRIKYFSNYLTDDVRVLKYIDFDDIKYFAKHITDDAFYKKLCEGKKISKFTDEHKWDCVYDEASGFWKSGFTKIQYFSDNGETAVTYYEKALPLNEDWFAALDEALLSGELGKIKNVSFLSYDVDNRKSARPYIGTDEQEQTNFDESLWDNVTDEFYSAWFAYIESDTGEYLFPCVIEGDMGIESGKVYELYECAEIMNANMYVVEDFYTELVEDEALNVWYFLAAFVIVLSGISVVIVLVRKKKKKGV